MTSLIRWKTSKKSALVLGAAAGSLALLASACSGAANTGDGAGAARTRPVTLEIGSPVTSLDPAKGSSFADLSVARTLYDTLVNFAQDGKIIPGLATSWSATADSATFHIRKGVSCSDGTAVTPAIVAASLKRFMDPATAAPLRGTVIGTASTATVTAEATANTVTVKLARPFSQLLPGMTSAFTGIICPAGLKNPSNLLTHSNGTGAYVASTQVSGSSYTFTARPGYTWGPKFPGEPAGSVPKTLVLKVVLDDNTAANLMSSNSLDIAAYSTTDWKRFAGKKGYTNVTQPQTDTTLVFNETSGHVTAEESVRVAISQALERDGMNGILGNGNGVLESNLGQATFECFDPSLASFVPKSNPSEASKALKGIDLRIIGSTQLASGNGTSYLLAQLNAAGAHATLRNMNNEAWVTELFSGKNDWDLTILGYANTTNTLLSAAGFSTGQAPPKGQNLGNVQNPTASSAYVTATKVAGSAGCVATTELQKALLQRHDLVPLSAIPATVVFSNGTAGSVVKGFVVPSSIRIN